MKWFSHEKDIFTSPDKWKTAISMLDASRLANLSEFIFRSLEYTENVQICGSWKIYMRHTRLPELSVLFAGWRHLYQIATPFYLFTFFANDASKFYPFQARIPRRIIFSCTHLSLRFSALVTHSRRRSSSRSFCITFFSLSYIFFLFPSSYSFLTQFLSAPGRNSWLGFSQNCARLKLVFPEPGLPGERSRRGPRFFFKGAGVPFKCPHTRRQNCLRPVRRREDETKNSARELDVLRTERVEENSRGREITWDGDENWRLT